MFKRFSATIVVSIGLILALASSIVLIQFGTGGNLFSTAAPYSPYVAEITFKDMLATVGQSKLPVFLEEYDPAYCDQSCETQHQVVNDLAQTYQGKINFYRVAGNSSEFRTGLVLPLYFMIDPPFSVYDIESGVKTEAQLTKFIDDAYAEITAPPPPPAQPVPPPVTPAPPVPSTATNPPGTTAPLPVSPPKP